MIRTLSQIAFIVGLIVVNVLSLLPHESMPEIGTGDKVNHFLAYAALSLAGVLGFNSRRALPIVGFSLLIMGIGLEFVQAILPSRTASGLDILANGVGIAVGCFAAATVNAFALRYPSMTG